jgi:UBA-like domain
MQMGNPSNQANADGSGGIDQNDAGDSSSTDSSAHTVYPEPPAGNPELPETVQEEGARDRSESESSGNAPEYRSESPSESSPDNEPEGSDDSDSDKTEWNEIIPEASRAVPVGNIVAQRPGRARQALSTPVVDPALVNDQQRSHRMWAMRQLLGEPVGITDAELNNALVASGWDLGTALRRMNDVFNEARRRHRQNVTGRSQAEQDRDRLLGALSLHHNRRRGISFLYTRLVQVVRADQVNMLTTLTLGQLLADHRFDVDEAVNAFLERLLHPDEIERHDRIERRLRMINPNQMHIDQRIARFMEITGTDDFYAARGLLRTHGFDMLRAMDHWMQTGLAAYPIPPSERNRTLFRMPRQAHGDIQNMWLHPRPLAGRLDNIDAEDLADADMDYLDMTDPVRRGWLIRYPRSEARIGINIPTRRRCNYIRLGEYTSVEVIKYKPHTGKDKGVVEPFDYNNSKHVQHLNSEASQWFRRVPGEKSKDKGVAYQEDENEWLWWWHNERLWEVIEQHPELLDATSLDDWERLGIRWPIKTDKARLTRDFNNHWGNRRPTRELRSLDAQRRRVIAICNDFGFPYSPAHPPKNPPRPPPSDDDDEDEDPKPPRKRAKKDKKGKNKVSHVDDMDPDVDTEVDEDGDGDNKDDDDDDAASSPLPHKTSCTLGAANRKKSSTSSIKRKRTDDDEDDGESESDYDDGGDGDDQPMSSGKKSAGTPRRSGRNRGSGGKRMAGCAVVWCGLGAERCSCERGWVKLLWYGVVCYFYLVYETSGRRAYRPACVPA